jgi:aconitate hydratase 2/2-methylisocitrate dehydratase
VKIQPEEGGHDAIFAAAGSRMELPGCSLCMGNQARVEENTTVFTSSTRNFNNRLGNGAQVYLGSAELAAACAHWAGSPARRSIWRLRPRKLGLPEKASSRPIRQRAKLGRAGACLFMRG